MKEQERENEAFDLDRELKDMARDVPEMPEEFRAHWRQALRAEISASREERAPEAAPAPAREELSSPSPAKNEKAPALRRFIPLISAAAVLLFLIGGTLATRGMLSPRLKAKSVVTENAATQSAAVEDAAVERAVMEEAVESEAMEAAVPEEMAMEEAVYYGYMAAESDMAAGSNKAAESDSGDSIMGGGSAAPEEPSLTALPSSLPPQALPENRNAAGSAPEAPDFGTRLGYFLEDMGAFLLAALPYLAGAGALALMAALIGKRRKSR